jgi:hypothetical protein
LGGHLRFFTKGSARDVHTLEEYNPNPGRLENFGRKWQVW